MITLYVLPWSHYCEKVSLALDHMRLPWRSVSIDAFAKAPLRSHPCPQQLPSRTVPAIFDDATQVYTMDSTPILRYLADTYPGAPRLFPAAKEARAAVDTQLLLLDSQLGILARRFAYTQMILECPAHLSELFLKHRAGGLYCAPGLRRISGAVMGMILTQRFEFHRSEALGLYEALERYLLDLAATVADREFLVGDELSAADLSLAALLRPLTIVPFFADHPGLQSLFARHRRVLSGGKGYVEFPYQAAIARARTTKAPVRRVLRSRHGDVPFMPAGNAAANDQKPLWTRRTVSIPVHYHFTLRHNKVRQFLASDRVR